MPLEEAGKKQVCTRLKAAGREWRKSEDHEEGSSMAYCGMPRRGRFRLAGATVSLLLAAGVCLPASALATAIPIGSKITVKAIAGSQSGVVEFAFPAGATINGTYDWSAADLPLTIKAADNTVLGTIKSLRVSYNADPDVTVGFDVTAGSQTTQFQISTAALTFAPMSNATAYAVASATVTDQDNSGFAKLSGKIPQSWGASACQAFYNGNTSWADFIYSMTVFSAGAQSVAEEGRPAPTPSNVRAPVPGQVSSIAMKWDFSLTSNDRAFGSSTFSVVPEPAAAVLLLAGLGCAIRRGR
jgi:hypothetical protein